MKRARSSVIDWRESSNGELIVFEDGQALDCSDDQNIYQRKMSCNQVVIIGLGSGYLLDKIVSLYPQLAITVIDCRESLVRAKIRRHPQVNFVVVQTVDELMSHPEYKTFLRVETDKFLFKKAAGSQLSFFQEIYWHLNLRTTDSLKNVVQLNKPLDDRWLINAKQLLESADHQTLPYKKAELLIIQELIK